MCGIAGFLDCKGKYLADELETTILGMADTIHHRGPDDYGVWVDATCGTALGFRRLAILDLSPAGHQPMHSANGRYVIVFNGEVYNFLDLRQELEQLGHRFIGHSDTEVMLAAVCQWGVEAAVPRFTGMFAFGLWDRQERQLHLVRDRIGIKPLYYGWAGDFFLFGSELKTLCAHPSFNAEINRDALALFFKYNYIPAPYSIYTGIYKLLAGTILTLNVSTSLGDLRPKPYWSAREVVERGLHKPFQGSEQEAVDELDCLLRRSVRERMVSDVPLGAFLSGGIDSSLIVAMMQMQSSLPVKTFTIGFHEGEYNEANYAKAVARHLMTDHTELYVSPNMAQAVIPRLPTLYDEPFADSSQIPTFLVAELTRQQVTVSLSGDGGDELFSGYGRYFSTPKRWRRTAWIPGIVRHAIVKQMEKVSPLDWQKNISLSSKNNDSGLQRFWNKAHRLGDLLNIDSADAMYQWDISNWKQPTTLVPGSQELPTVFSDRQQWINLPTLLDRMMYLDLVTYLPDDILVKVDRASMGVSLETRVPFLDDHRIVEFAWSLPEPLKVHNQKGKYLLRKVLYQYVPEALIERPKMGFGIPIGTWLRGPLREWTEALLYGPRLQKEGFLNPQPIHNMWVEHQSGARDWQNVLWGVLMFQAWLDTSFMK